MQQNLMEYSRGRLRSSEALAIERHLENCEECLSFLKEERDFDRRLAGLPAATPKNDVWVMVRSATSHRQSGWTWLLGLMPYSRRVFAAAMVAVAAGVLMFALPSQHTKVTEHERTVQRVIAQQADSQIAQKWTDDPLGSTTDQVVAAMEEEF